MRNLTVVYKWENGKEGSFGHPRFPEPIDVARLCLKAIEDEAYRETVAQAMSTSPAFTSQYWGWFRQVLVTWRADAKRLREGNKSTISANAEDTAKVMAAKALPTYAEPSEGKDIVTKISEVMATLSPAQIEALRAQLGITVHTS
jgi:hypothetical protein